MVNTWAIYRNIICNTVVNPSRQSYRLYTVYERTLNARTRSASHIRVAVRSVIPQVARDMLSRSCTNTCPGYSPRYTHTCIHNDILYARIHTRSHARIHADSVRYRNNGRCLRLLNPSLLIGPPAL